MVDVELPTAPSGAADGMAVEGSSAQVADALSQLFRALGRMRPMIAEWSGNPSLNPSAFFLIGSLVNAGPQSASALADVLCLDLSWVSRQATQLVWRGLVERRADRADGRVSILAATAAGEELYSRIRMARDAYFAAQVADWPEEDRRHLVELLGRLSGRLESGTAGSATD